MGGDDLSHIGLSSPPSVRITSRSPSSDQVSGKQSARSGSSSPLLTINETEEVSSSLSSSSHQPMAYASVPHLDAPLIDSQTLITIFNHLRNVLTSKEAASQKKEISSANKQLQAQHSKVIKKIHDSIKKSGKRNKLDVISKVLGWIGTVAAVVVAVVVTIATGGSAWPLLAVALVGLGMMIMSETGTMNKMISGMGSGFAKLLESFGVSKAKADEIGQYMAVVTVVAVVIAANIIAAVASGGGTASETAALLFQATRLIDSVTQASMLATQGGTDIAKAVYTSGAETDRADEADFHAIIKKLNTDKDQVLTDMKRTSKLIQSTNTAAYEMLRSFNEGEEFTIEKMV